ATAPRTKRPASSAHAAPALRLARIIRVKIGFFLHTDPLEGNATRETRSQSAPDVDGQRLGRWDRLAVCELRHVEIEVAVIEPRHDLVVEDAIERRQVHHHLRLGRHGTPYGHEALITMAVPMFAGA